MQKVKELQNFIVTVSSDEVKYLTSKHKYEILSKIIIF